MNDGWLLALLIVMMASANETYDCTLPQVEEYSGQMLWGIYEKEYLCDMGNS
ncbi:hypothetical protein M3201_07495 [Paenibacillus motobuensis]|uniref:hypothetical protein n=1 Tax=Paenibacillus TaxID=44249 RepID=UPI0013A65DE2|nr:MULTISPECIES: hypothetical protein [Paenibacillus]MCM3039542.1 hypothetical protein [Paenibacillus lutimineralis]MCM3646646.1 hypothetical protein [Paenibacillus motobuensis]